MRFKWKPELTRKNTDVIYKVIMNLAVNLIRPMPFADAIHINFIAVRVSGGASFSNESSSILPLAIPVLYSSGG